MQGRPTNVLLTCLFNCTTKLTLSVVTSFRLFSVSTLPSYDKTAESNTLDIPTRNTVPSRTNNISPTTGNTISSKIVLLDVGPSLGQWYSATIIFDRTSSRKPSEQEVRNCSGAAAMGRLVARNA